MSYYGLEWHSPVGWTEVQEGPSDCLTIKRIPYSATAIRFETVAERDEWAAGGPSGLSEDGCRQSLTREELESCFEAPISRIFAGNWEGGYSGMDYEDWLTDPYFGGKES